MRTSKLQRFKENRHLDNVSEYTDFENGSNAKPAGLWSVIFGNNNPLILELACGRGEYALNMAGMFPDANFIGIDIKGARIWKGAKKAKEESVSNVHFIRMYIDHIDQYFNPGEVSDIWITFPDPYLKMRQADKRLTSPRFLRLYKRILSKGGTVNLKTDSGRLYNYTLETLEREGYKLLKRIGHVYQENPDDPLLSIRTAFEESHLQRGKKIRYLKFSLD